jgi:hypothetical protein
MSKYIIIYIKMGGSLTPDEFADLKNGPYAAIKYFVETGTYKADTTLLVAPLYEHVYSTEIHEGLHDAAIQRVADAGVTNITLLLGDSATLMQEIMPKVREGAVYFLDAHISGADSSWNGQDRVPVMLELDAILEHKIGPSVFIIDDLRFWTTQKAWDWSHVSNRNIVKKFKDRGIKVSSFYENNDRFYVFTE